MLTVFQTLHQNCRDFFSAANQTELFFPNNEGEWVADDSKINKLADRYVDDALIINAGLAKSIAEVEDMSIDVRVVLTRTAYKVFKMRANLIANSIGLAIFGGDDSQS